MINTGPLSWLTAWKMSVDIYLFLPCWFSWSVSIYNVIKWKSLGLIWPNLLWESESVHEIKGFLNDDWFLSNHNAIKWTFLIWLNEEENERGRKKERKKERESENALQKVILVWKTRCFISANRMSFAIESLIISSVFSSFPRSTNLMQSGFSST